MKVVVWNGCSVISSTEYEGDGPDIHLDPVNLPETISVRRQSEYGELSQSVDISRFARLEGPGLGEQVPGSTQVP